MHSSKGIDFWCFLVVVLQRRSLKSCSPKQLKAFRVYKVSGTPRASTREYMVRADEAGKASAAQGNKRNANPRQRL